MVDIMTTDEARAALARNNQFAVKVAAVQSAISYGVHPNIAAALSAWSDLQSFVADNPAYADTLTAIMGAAADNVDTLVAGMQALQAGIEAAERVQPGTFGIALPDEEQPE